MAMLASWYEPGQAGEQHQKECRDEDLLEHLAPVGHLLDLWRGGVLLGRRVEHVRYVFVFDIRFLEFEALRGNPAFARGGADRADTQPERLLATMPIEDVHAVTLVEGGQHHAGRRLA